MSVLLYIEEGRAGPSRKRPERVKGPDKRAAGTIGWIGEVRAHLSVTLSHNILKNGFRCVAACSQKLTDEIFVGIDFLYKGIR